MADRKKRERDGEKNKPSDKKRYQSVDGVTSSKSKEKIKEKRFLFHFKSRVESTSSVHASSFYQLNLLADLELVKNHNNNKKTEGKTIDWINIAVKRNEINRKIKKDDDQEGKGESEEIEGRGAVIE